MCTCGPLVASFAHLFLFVFVLKKVCQIVFFCVFQPCGHLLGKGWPIGSPVRDFLLCFCHFSIRCLGSGVVLDCIYS